MTLDPQICQWDTTSTLFIFSDNVFGDFIYYSHLLPVLALLCLTVALLWQNWRDPVVQSLAFISFAFTAWSLSDLILWSTAYPPHTMFFWSNIIHFELLVYIGALYFTYHFVAHRGLGWKKELLLLALYLPIIFFAHTNLNLVGFDYTNCDREATEGPLLIYVYTLELFIAFWILAISAFYFFKSKTDGRRTEVFLGSFAVLAFLFSFSFGNIMGTIADDWEVGQYGLFVIPIFAGLLTYLIIQYRSVNAKIFATEALVVGIIILIFSTLLATNLENIRTIIVATSILVCFLGLLLVQSVRREIKQREEIEKLAKDLAKANARLRKLDQLKSEFVSIASHQLRSPLTSIRGYTSMILEGSYGKINKKVTDIVSRIQASSRYMALTVEDFLNVSRIESGTMKYAPSDFDICDMVKTVYEDIKPAVAEKQLDFTFTSNIKGVCTVHADAGKVRQIIQNLIDNATKYTPKGSISVILNEEKTKKQVEIVIKDTGIGMAPETLHEIFHKFARAKNANSVNVIGSGLGLYVAKEMAEKMGGSIKAESEGEGKGSTFTIYLPLAGKQSKSSK